MMPLIGRYPARWEVPKVRRNTTANASDTRRGPDILTARQLRAVDMLMAGETVTGTAEALHVTRRTVQRWLTEDNFAEALENAQGAAMSSAARRLAGKLDRAAALVCNLAETAEDEPVRLKAALSIVDMYARLREMGDVGAQIAELQRAVGV
jgi:hypothetical protein